jgi:hypothetical protein
MEENDIVLSTIRSSKERTVCRAQTHQKNCPYFLETTPSVISQPPNIQVASSREGDGVRRKAMCRNHAETGTVRFREGDGKRSQVRIQVGIGSGKKIRGRVRRGGKARSRPSASIHSSALGRTRRGS